MKHGTVQSLNKRICKGFDSADKRILWRAAWHPKMLYVLFRRMRILSLDLKVCISSKFAQPLANKVTAVIGLACLQYHLIHLIKVTKLLSKK